MKVITTIVCCTVMCVLSIHVFGHGTVISPPSRVYRVFMANPENPNFILAQNAVMMDSKNAYYTWNQVSQNIPQAVQAGLPPGFDYSPWVPNGQIASGGRVDSAVFGELTYSGLDQVSSDWPMMQVMAGEIIEVDFHATAVHEPSTWDFWMTTSDWDPNSALSWDQMEFMGRQDPVLVDGHYYFDFAIPADRSGHHVLWVAWHRDDPVGEVFFSASDIFVNGGFNPCPETINLATVDRSVYHAAESISCSAQITEIVDVSLKSGDYIELLPFFEVATGISLNLIIQDCGAQSGTGQSGARNIHQKPIYLIGKMHRRKELDEHSVSQDVLH